MLLVFCFGDEVEGVLVVGHSLSLDGHAVLSGAGRGEVVEQHLTHGGITGRAAFRCMLVDRNEEGHDGTSFDRRPDKAVTSMLDVSCEQAKPEAIEPKGSHSGTLVPSAAAQDSTGTGTFG